MATLMQIDGIAVEIEWDPDEDLFSGVADVPGGGVSIHGRSVDELRAAFRDIYKAHRGPAAGSYRESYSGKGRPRPPHLPLD